MFQNLARKLRGLLRSRKADIDQGLDKAEQAISDRTGGKYDDQPAAPDQSPDPPDKRDTGDTGPRPR